MMLDDIRAAHARRPFRPFAMYFSEGPPVRVARPELLLIPPGRARSLIVARSAGRIHLVDVELVVELELEPGRAARWSRRVNAGAERADGRHRAATRARKRSKR